MAEGPRGRRRSLRRPCIDPSTSARDRSARRPPRTRSRRPPGSWSTSSLIEPLAAGAQAPPCLFQLGAELPVGVVAQKLTYTLLEQHLAAVPVGLGGLTGGR